MLAWFIVGLCSDLLLEYIIIFIIALITSSRINRILYALLFSVQRLAVPRNLSKPVSLCYVILRLDSNRAAAPFLRYILDISSANRRQLLWFLVLTVSPG